jgi:hypothetical protein
MSKAGNKLLQRINKDISKLSWNCLPQDTPIVIASASDSGMTGAAIAVERILNFNSTVETNVDRNSLRNLMASIKFLVAGASFLSMICNDAGTSGLLSYVTTVVSMNCYRFYCRMQS